MVALFFSFEKRVVLGVVVLFAFVLPLTSLLTHTCVCVLVGGREREVEQWEVGGEGLLSLCEIMTLNSDTSSVSLGSGIYYLC